MAEKIKRGGLLRTQPYPRVDPWQGQLKPLPPKAGASAASQMYPHLRSKFDPPAQRQTPPKGTR